MTTTRRLLVIDDEPGFRRFVQRVGEAAGFETCVTSEALVFKSRVRDWDPSMIMMDLNMPGADGVELLRDLAEWGATAPILIASGGDAKLLDAVGDLATERGLVLAGVLTKPIRAHDLRDALKRIEKPDAPRPGPHRPIRRSALAQAIAEGALLLEYQPKLDLKTGRIFGAEALVRWRHALLGVLSPDRFIPIAEKSGLICDLTRWVAAEAIRQAALWRDEGLALNVAINISAHDLRSLELPDRLETICTAAGVPSDALTLEVTETAAIRDPIRSKDVLTRLRLKGFSLSIDDFGTGYSALAHLRHLPYSELKIDKSFVSPMRHDRDCRAIVESVLELARKLGMRVVAEGIETADLLALIRDLGADAGQGYFIGRPVNSSEIANLVARTSFGRESPDKEPGAIRSSATGA